MGGIQVLYDGKIWIGSCDKGPVFLLPSMANRHGLIAGATGTGKTVSLKVLAEGFSDMGVPGGKVLNGCVFNIIVKCLNCIYP